MSIILALTLRGKSQLMGGGGRKVQQSLSDEEEEESELTLFKRKTLSVTPWERSKKFCLTLRVRGQSGLKVSSLIWMALWDWSIISRRKGLQTQEAGYQGQECWLVFLFKDMSILFPVLFVLFTLWVIMNIKIGTLNINGARSHTKRASLFQTSSAFWHFNTTLSEDQAFRQALQVLWDAHRLHRWWDFGRTVIQQFCQQYTGNITKHMMKSFKAKMLP